MIRPGYRLNDDDGTLLPIFPSPLTEPCCRAHRFSMEGGSASDVFWGAAAGAGTGALFGAIDPTFGTATVTILAGLASGAGDATAQLLGGAGGPCKPFNWRSTGAAVAGGAIGGLTGGALGELATAAEESEVQSAVANNLVSNNIGTPVTGVFAAVWPQATSGRKTGCH